MIQSDTVIVLQARLGSTRLPGKVLRRLAGDTLVGHCLRRLTAAGVAPVVLATTVSSEDDGLGAEAERFGVRTIRGARVDVLRRFAQVIRQTGAAYVVRATADNPAVDCRAAYRVLATLRSQGADYCCEQDLPCGAAVEAVRADALLDAGARATEAYDREHVTTYIKFNPRRYRVLMTHAPAALRRPDLRLTVDTAADLAYMDRILEASSTGGAPAPLLDIIRAADALAAEKEGGMIAVTRLDGTPILLNIDLIEYIEETPDTMISLADGAKLVVRETSDQILDRVIEFKRAVAHANYPRDASRAPAKDPAVWTDR